MIWTVNLGKITEEEIRRYPEGKPAEPGELVSRLNGCSVLIVADKDPICRPELADHRIKCVVTGESLLTNIMVSYLDQEYRRASDTCCCP